MLQLTSGQQHCLKSGQRQLHTPKPGGHGRRGGTQRPPWSIQAQLAVKELTC